MLSKLKAYDVVKITLNASTGTLVCKVKGNKQNEAQQEGLKELERQLGRYTPDPPYDYSVMTARKLPQFLAQAVQKAALGGMESDRGLVVEPLVFVRLEPRCARHANRYLHHPRGSARLQWEDRCHPDRRGQARHPFTLRDLPQG